MTQFIAIIVINLVSPRGEAGSARTNGREPRSCLGRVFNSKLGHIATLGSKCMQPLLKLKTQPMARPVRKSLSVGEAIH